MDLSTQQSLEQIAKFLSGNMSPGELALFQDWLEENPASQQMLQEASGVWQLGEEETIPDFDKDMDVAWTKVEQHIQRKPIGTTRKLKVSFRSWAPRIAASLAFILLAAWALTQWRQGDTETEMVAYTTGPNETLSIVLPDSSTVWLNERSTLRRPADFSKRSIQLEGEAYFQIRRMEHSPFRIESGAAMTEVLGTSFNVRAYPEEEKVELTVVTGKVAFGRADAPKTRLLVEAGASAVLDEKRETALQAEEKISNAESWHTGKLLFEDATLEMVRLSFERFYGIRLEVGDPAIWNCHFTGSFVKAPAAELAQAIAFSLNLELQQSDSVFTLSGKGCESQ